MCTHRNQPCRNKKKANRGRKLAQVQALIGSVLLEMNKLNGLVLDS